MKIMKKTTIIYLSLFAGAALAVAACKKSFLDVKPQGTTLESNFYQSPSDAFAAVVAAYNPLSWTTVSSYCPKMVLLNLASDDAYAGGGSNTDNPGMQAWNTFTLSSATPNVPPDLWSRNYSGIYRANVVLEKVTGVPGLTDALKARYTADMKFLRAYYYFDLVRLFGNIPLITAVLQQSDFFNQLQVKPALVYAQIEKDLNDAIPNLPATLDPSENGRATKGAAQALLGKVILYQNDNTRMQEAANDFEQVNSSPNYHLLPNYGDIFIPTNKFNAESVWEIVHTNASGRSWGSFGNDDGNVGVQMVGPRAYTGPVYESNTAGYGFNPLTLSLVTALKGDPRYAATVVNIDSLAKAGYCTYDKTGYQNTGYFVRKFAPLAQYQATVGVIPLNWTNDEIEIRLADTYLMEAEALVRGSGDMSKAQSYLDKVRARVGLPSVPATLANIYNERRLELATEGHRFFDLVRTGQASTVLASKGFQAGKNEILPIPLQELNNTKLVQNPGYN
jgi:hypothetical protein